MLQFYGTQPPGPLNALRCGGTCPHCGQRASFTRMHDLIENVAKAAKLSEVMITYHCDACLRPIPVAYDVIDWDPTRVDRPRVALPVRETFDVEHVPAEVVREVDEALACLSVGAHHGFGAMARRVVQAVVRDIGADGAARVASQLDEMLALSGVDEALAADARRLLLPADEADLSLPDMDARRAAVVLSLMRDLTYQLYTRPGRVRAAAGA
jgi:hypothetical protein